MSRGLSGDGRQGGGARALRALCLCFAALAALLLQLGAANALKAIEIDPELERIDITGLGEAYEGRGDNLRIETAPGRPDRCP
jgi:hypothetical protein